MYLQKKNYFLLLASTKPDPRLLQPINESTETHFFPSLFTWTFQHCSQIVGLTLRIMFTKQIEACLASSQQNKTDELKKMGKKFESLIDLYSKQLIAYQFQKHRKHSASTDNSSKNKLSLASNSAIVINKQQHDKLDLIVKLLIYYRTVLKELIAKKCESADSPEWTSIIRFYFANQNNQICVLIKVI